MDFEHLKEAQKPALNILSNSYRKGRLSHAYIFEGAAGSMKFDTALFFASLLLCQAEEHRPCGTCSNCRRVQHLTHPNLYVVRPTKRQILKESIQALRHEFSKTKVEEGPRLYIIEDADAMNPHAGNALLKFLEEPHEDMYAVLLVEDAQYLLPTLRSRSQIVPFHPLPKKSIEKVLGEEGYDKTFITLASKLNATPDEARAFLDDEHLESIVEAIDAVYASLNDQNGALLAFREQAEEFVRNKQTISTLLDVLIHYQKDVIYGKIGNRNQIVFADRIDTIEALAERYELDNLLLVLEHMLQLKARQQNYVNTRLALDNIMLELERGLTDGK